MESKEKKEIILRDVVKSELKKADYQISGSTYHALRNDCRVIVNVQSSRFNSAATGYSFWFNISTIPAEIPLKELKYRMAEFSFIRESLLLPDCGYLHPYRNGADYCIDGYKSYQPQNMDVEKIRDYIQMDLQKYILPQLEEVQSLSDWARKKSEWEQNANSQRITLLRYFSVAQMLAPAPETVEHLILIQSDMALSNEAIKENEALYQQSRAFSAWPDHDKWPMIQAAVEKNEPQ